MAKVKTKLVLSIKHPRLAVFLNVLPFLFARLTGTEPRFFKPAWLFEVNSEIVNRSEKDEV